MYIVYVKLIPPPPIARIFNDIKTLDIVLLICYYILMGSIEPILLLKQSTFQSKELITLSDLTNVAVKSDEPLNSYQRLVRDIETGSGWNKEYAETHIQSYYFERPTKTVAQKAVAKLLGKLPNKSVLEMDRVKSSKPSSLLHAVIMVVVAGAISVTLMALFPITAKITMFSAVISPIALLPDPFTWVALAALGYLVWRFRNSIFSYYTLSGPLWSRSFVRSSKSSIDSETAGIHTLMYRTGAEKWSSRQKIGAVIYSAMASSMMAIFWLPIAFVPSMIFTSSYLLYYYLSANRKYKDSMQASVETTRVASMYKLLFPVYLGTGIAIWLNAVDFWSKFGELLIKIGQALLNS